MLAVVVAGVARSLFFWLAELAGLALVFSVVSVAVAELCLDEAGRSDDVGRGPWVAALGRGCSLSTSAAFRFRVMGGVMSERQSCRG
jgi:hypothetical protein